MEQKLKFLGREFYFNISPQASVALQVLEAPLFVEMELLIDDLCQKTLRCGFGPTANIYYQWLSPKIALAYCPFLTVGYDGTGKSANLIDRPIKKFQNKPPNYLELDYYNEQFTGSFTLYYKPKPQKKLKQLAQHLIKPLLNYHQK
ncbi:MAG: hypothetical protein QNL04_12960 [SAR324 cluster bacterium]|nr:hypothetical protein [SAR324 cluster bacterium]